MYKQILQFFNFTYAKIEITFKVIKEKDNDTCIDLNFSIPLYLSLNPQTNIPPQYSANYRVYTRKYKTRRLLAKLRGALRHRHADWPSHRLQLRLSPVRVLCCCNSASLVVAQLQQPLCFYFYLPYQRITSPHHRTRLIRTPAASEIQIQS